MDWRAPRYVAVATHIPGFLTASFNSGRVAIRYSAGERKRLDSVMTCTPRSNVICTLAPGDASHISGATIAATGYRFSQLSESSPEKKATHRFQGMRRSSSGRRGRRQFKV